MLARLPLPQESTWPRYAKISSPFVAFAILMFTSKPSQLSDTALCLVALCLIIYLVSVIVDNTYALTPKLATNAWLQQETGLIKAQPGRYWFWNKERLVILEPIMILRIKKQAPGLHGDCFSDRFDITVTFDPLRARGHRDASSHTDYLPFQIPVEAAQAFVDWHQELSTFFDSLETSLFLSESLKNQKLLFHIEVSRPYQFV